MYNTRNIVHCWRTPCSPGICSWPLSWAPTTRQAEGSLPARLSLRWRGRAVGVSGWTVLGMRRVANSKLLEGWMNAWVDVAAGFFHFFRGLLFLSKPFRLTLYHKRALFICSVSLCLCFLKTLFLEKKSQKEKKSFVSVVQWMISQRKRRTNHFRSTAQLHCFRWHKSWISNAMQKSSQFSKLSLYSANCFCKQE